MTQIQIALPNYQEPYCSAQAWVLQVVFDEWLGVTYTTTTSLDADYHIHIGAKTLTLPDIFFSQLAQHGRKTGKTWGTSLILPKLPLAEWDVAHESFASHFVVVPEAPLPILYGHAGITQVGENYQCHVDLLGAIFVILSRYEEVIQNDVSDEHDRFPAVASLMYKAGLLQRPIVDEMVEVLWACLAMLQPNLQRKSLTGRIMVTCDVDSPFERYVHRIDVLGRVLLGALRRGDWRETHRRWRNYRAYQRRDYELDRNYVFDWYMDACEMHQHRVHFFFIPDATSSYDAYYQIGEERIKDLLSMIHQRGHAIGTHGSYNAFRDFSQIQRERHAFQQVCQQVGITDVPISNRQHYLRWDSAQTPDHLANAGYQWDTTGGFADVAGFRFGTSRPFSMWGWQSQRALALQQYPLIMMEATVMSSKYMGLYNSDRAYALMQTLRERSHRYGGNFVLLWHNSFFMADAERDFFLASIDPH